MKATLDRTTRYRPTPHCALNRVGDETILLHLENGTYYGLDESGTAVWARLQDGISLSDLVDDMARLHGVPRATLEQDMAPFLQDLLSNELIVPADDAVSAP